MYRLYDYLPSGNGYKVRLLLTQLGIPFELVELDITEGRDAHAGVPGQESQRAHPDAGDRARRLPAGVERDPLLPRRGHAVLPADRLERAQVLQWMCFEQYSHEPNIATVRFWVTHDQLTPERRAQLDQKRALGYAALGVMEQHLARRTFFVGERYSIADIALYAYTHVADEGGFDLAPYAAVRALAASACAAQPGHIPITQRSEGAKGSRFERFKRSGALLEALNPRTLPTHMNPGWRGCFPNSSSLRAIRSAAVKRGVGLADLIERRASRRPASPRRPRRRSPGR